MSEQAPNGTPIRCSQCGHTITVDYTHNAQSDLSARHVGGTHVCDRFEYGFFELIPKILPSETAIANARQAWDESKGDWFGVVAAIQAAYLTDGGPSEHT